MLNEISSWFLNIRFYLHALKMSDTKWYKYNALCFFLSFFFCRIVFNSVVGIWVWKALQYTIKGKGVSYIVKLYNFDLQFFGVPVWQSLMGGYMILVFVMLYILNIVWFIALIGHLKRTFYPRRKHQGYMELSQNNNSDSSDTKNSSSEINGNPPVQSFV